MTTNHGDRCWCSRCDASRAVNLLAEIQAGTTPERAAEIAAQAEQIADRSPRRHVVNEDVRERDVDACGHIAKRCECDHAASVYYGRG